MGVSFLIVPLLVLTIFPLVVCVCVCVFVFRGFGDHGRDAAIVAGVRFLLIRDFVGGYSDGRQRGSRPSCELIPDGRSWETGCLWAFV